MASWLLLFTTRKEFEMEMENAWEWNATEALSSFGVLFVVLVFSQLWSSMLVHGSFIHSDLDSVGSCWLWFCSIIERLDLYRYQLFPQLLYYS